MDDRWGIGDMGDRGGIGDIGYKDDMGDNKQWVTDRAKRAKRAKVWKWDYSLEDWPV